MTQTQAFILAVLTLVAATVLAVVGIVTGGEWLALVGGSAVGGSTAAAAARARASSS